MRQLINKIQEKKNRGFTLAELLIVVAIIAVLVAIAIPVFTRQLENSRDAVSASNIRAAYAEASSAWLTQDAGGTNSGITINKDNKTVTVSNVVFKGTVEGWSGQLEDMPFDRANGILADATGGKAGTYSLTFTFEKGNGKTQLTGCSGS